MPDTGKKNQEARGGKPLLEWISAALGLLLTLALLGFIGWQAVKAPEKEPPAVAVAAGPVSQVPGGYVVEVTAKNHAASTAAVVEVEGTLGKAGAKAERSSVTFDYIPGQSERKGGLFFQRDPRSDQLEVRALGYAEP